MTNYNTVILTGNTGAEAETYTSENNREFVALSIYTQNSYKDENDQWVNGESTIHKVLAFKPWVIAALLSYKGGARLKITGKLSYRPFKVMLDDGRIVQKQEAVIIADQVETAALFKKADALQLAFDNSVN